MKVFPRGAEESPRGLKAQEGIELLAGLNRLLVTTDRCPDQSPGGESRRSGAEEVTSRQEKLEKRQEGTASR
jgi:hypothetical protein